MANAYGSIGVQAENHGGDDNFMLSEIGPDLYRCKEQYYQSWNVANIWVVKGTRSDLVIDTGIGLWDLSAFLREKQILGDKPVQAVATHVHFDHSGGLHQFEQIAIHEEEADFLRSGDSYAACCFMSRAEIKKPPTEKWSPRDYKLRPANPTRILRDGDVFDLGDKQLRVLHLPGHSKGSIVLFDEASGNLFSGDIAGKFPAVDWLPYGNVADMIETMETLQEMAPRVQRVLPGHGDPVDGTELKEITSRYLKNAGMCHDCTAGITGALASVLLKGRNTKETGPRCCYQSCCCCICMG